MWKTKNGFILVGQLHPSQNAPNSTPTLLSGINLDSWPAVENRWNKIMLDTWEWCGRNGSHSSSFAPRCLSVTAKVGSAKVCQLERSGSLKTSSAYRILQLQVFRPCQVRKWEDFGHLALSRGYWLLKAAWYSVCFDIITFGRLLS